VEEALFGSAEGTSEGAGVTVGDGVAMV